MRKCFFYLQSSLINLTAEIILPWHAYGIRAAVLAVTEYIDIPARFRPGLFDLRTGRDTAIPEIMLRNQRNNIVDGGAGLTDSFCDFFDMKEIDFLDEHGIDLHNHAGCCRLADARQLIPDQDFCRSLSQ